MVLRAQMINFFTINLEDFSQLGFSMTGTPRQKTEWRTKKIFPRFHVRIIWKILINQRKISQISFYKPEMIKIYLGKMYWDDEQDI